SSTRTLQRRGRTPPRGDAASSERVDPAFASSDADHLVHWKHEDLAVTDLSRLGGALNGLDHARRLVVVDDDLNLHLRQEVNNVFGALVELCVATLAAKPLDLHRGQPVDPHLGKSVLHLVQLERLDDGLNLLHPWAPGLSVARATANRLNPTGSFHI